MEAFLDVVRRAAAEALPERAGRVLEIGPANGQWLLEMARRLRPDVVVTADIVPHVLFPEAAELSPKAVRAGGDRLPFRAGTFDAVACVNVSSVLPHGALRRVIRGMQRSLRPEGRAVLTVQNRAHPVLYFRMASQPRRYRAGLQPFAYRVSDVVRWIREFGGRKIRIRPVNFGIPRYESRSLRGPFQLAMTAVHHHLVNRHARTAPVCVVSWESRKEIVRDLPIR